MKALLTNTEKYIAGYDPYEISKNDPSTGIFGIFGTVQKNGQNVAYYIGTFCPKICTEKL